MMSNVVSLRLVLCAALLAGTACRQGSPPSKSEGATQGDPAPAEKASRPSPVEVKFREASAEAGIDFVHVNGAFGKKWLPETMGSGLAFLDYDNDGDQDLFLVQGTAWPGHGRGTAARQALFRNDG